MTFFKKVTFLTRRLCYFTGQPLKEIYVGFFADVDAPNSQDRNSPVNDNVGFALNGGAPFVFDSSIQGNEIPLLGAMILGVNDPIVSWWNADNDPYDDQQHYAYLKGDVPTLDPDQPDDFRFLVSYGPLTLKAGETVQFPVAVAQAPQLSSFEVNLNDAVEFFTEELGGVSLQKAAADFSAQTAATKLLPQAFKLYPNFPTFGLIPLPLMTA